MDIETRTIFPCELEIRQGNIIRGIFPYNSQATVSDRGRIRKERFAPQAFDFVLDDETREVSMLYGHNFSQPLASRRAGSLVLTDTPQALTFEAALPPVETRPSWVQDAVYAIENRLATGISPGFRIPPSDVVPDAEVIRPEVGNPSVSERIIRKAVLIELSVVARPSYQETSAELRASYGGGEKTVLPHWKKRTMIWL